MKEEIMQALIAGEEVASEDVLEYINDLKEQVRKKTAKEILTAIYFNPKIKLSAELTATIDELAEKYTREVDE